MLGARVRGMMTAVVAALALVASSASVASAQGRPHPNGNAIMGAKPRRAQLERQFRERGEQIVRRQLNLSDDQMSRLRAVNGRYDGQRSALLLQERDARVALRNELARGSGADQGRVAQLMSQVRTLQQQRFALQEQEQKDLSGFLTPVQQAQYYGLVAQLRQRARELRAQQGDSAPMVP